MSFERFKSFTEEYLFQESTLEVIFYKAGNVCTKINITVIYYWENRD
jgi:hypothetical protein